MSLDLGNTDQFNLTLNQNLNAGVNVTVSGEERIAELERQLAAANEQLSQAQNQLAQATDKAQRLRGELDSLKENTGIKFLQERISELEFTLSRAREQFEQFASAANLFGADAWGTDVQEFIAAQAADIEKGLITVDEAKTRLKTQFSNLFSSGSGSSFDAEVMQTIIASLHTMSEAIVEVQTKMNTLLTSGISAGSGGGGQVSDVLDQINRATAGLSEEARVAYEPVTNLISALVEFSKVPSDNIYGVSRTFENLSSVMGRSLGTKTVTNLTALLTSLQQIATQGSINLNLDVTGINELQNKRAALKNLADYLPQIAHIDSTKLDALSKINLSNFNNIKVSKASIDSIAQLAEALRMLHNVPGLIEGIGKKTGDDGATQKQLNNFERLANTVQRLGGSLNTSQGIALRLQGDESTGYLATIQKLRGEVTALESDCRKAAQSGDADFDDLNNRALKLEASVRQVAIALGNMKLTDPSAGDKVAQTASSNLSLLRQIETSAKSASSLLSNNTKLFGTELGSQLQGVIGKYDSLIQHFKDTPPTTKAATDQVVSQLNELKEETASIGLEMERTGLKGNTMMTRFAQGIKKFGGWTIVTRALTAVIRLGRQLVTNVKEIDSAMTQLKIVTSGTSTEISRFGDNIAETAKEIGASITDLVDSATTYARLGYSLDESSILAKYTSMLKAVGDIEVSDAQDAITAITKAYSDVDINNIESVMDILVKVGKESCPAA